MSIKTRLKQVEEKFGVNGRPAVLWFRTIYENKDGSSYTSGGQAALQIGKTYLGTEPMAENETYEEFKARVRERCFELTGQYPERT